MHKQEIIRTPGKACEAMHKQVHYINKCDENKIDFLEIS